MSAISRPRPITSTWSAVSSISCMRWLETITVRPSAAKRCSSVRIQRMPSGSRPFIGSSNSSVAGSPSSAEAMPEPLRHAEREAADAAAGDVGEPDLVEHLLDAAARQPARVGQPAQVVAGGALAVDRAGVEQRADLVHRRRRGRGSASRRRGRSPTSGGRGRGSCASWSTCPRRSARGSPVTTPGPDVEGEPVDGDRVAVALGETACLDHRAFFRCSSMTAVTTIAMTMPMTIRFLTFRTVPSQVRQVEEGDRGEVELGPGDDPDEEVDHDHGHHPAGDLLRCVHALMIGIAPPQHIGRRSGLRLRLQAERGRTSPTS